MEKIIKKLGLAFVVCLMLAMLFIAGCNNFESGNFNQEQFENRESIQGEQRPSTERMQEVNQEQMEEMMQIGIDSCANKEQGDLCEIETPRGIMESTCEFNQNEQLVCMPSRPENMGQERMN